MTSQDIVTQLAQTAFREALEAVSAPESLLLRAQRGDEAAFKALYKIHSGRVYAFCLRLSRTRREAAVLAERVFLKLFRDIQTYRDESEIVRRIAQIAAALAARDLTSAT